MPALAVPVADQVFERIERLLAAEGVSRAEAIRRVAAESGRTPSAVSSAYYSGARRARAAAADPPPPEAPASGRRSGRSGSHSDAPRLYAEMLPLVEAGASVEQAARRFGDDDESVAEIAAGFSRWIARGQGPAAAAAPAVEPADDPALADLRRDLHDAQGRVAVLEAENRGLRRDLTRARQAITRTRAILDSATE